MVKIHYFRFPIWIRNIRFNFRFQIIILCTNWIRISKFNSLNFALFRKYRLSSLGFTWSELRRLELIELIEKFVLYFNVGWRFPERWKFLLDLGNRFRRQEACLGESKFQNMISEINQFRKWCHYFQTSKLCSSEWNSWNYLEIISNLYSETMEIISFD